MALAALCVAVLALFLACVAIGATLALLQEIRR